MKTCKKCQLSKELSDFPHGGYDRNKIKRYKNVCKECNKSYMKKYHKEYSVKNYDKIYERNKLYRLSHKRPYTDKDKLRTKIKNSEKRKIAKDWLDNIKLSSGCISCGYKSCSATLDFHHIKPETKSFQIARAASQGRPIKYLEPEVKKCVVLCANCHREITCGFKELKI